MLDSKCFFTLLRVINEDGEFVKRLSPASFHMWTGSLDKMLVSLKAWSPVRLWENDYGLNLWLLSTGHWTLCLLLLLLQWSSKFLFPFSFYLPCFSLFGQEIVFSLDVDTAVWVLCIVIRQTFFEDTKDRSDPTVTANDTNISDSSCSWMSTGKLLSIFYAESLSMYGQGPSSEQTSKAV